MEYGRPQPVVVLWAGAAQAQTADEAVEKALAAMGGRAALTKLNTRVITGTITVSTQGVDIPGTVEMSYKAPNLARSFMKLDLSTFGGAEMVIDRRCDGKTAFEINSQTGVKEITGNQLENMLNASFPSPFLNYKQAGAQGRGRRQGEAGRQGRHRPRLHAEDRAPSRSCTSTRRRGSSCGRWGR